MLKWVLINVKCRESFKITKHSIGTCSVGKVTCLENSEAVGTNLPSYIEEIYGFLER